MPSESESLAAIEPAVTAEDRAARAVRADGNDGWVTARPPRAKEVVRRILGLPGLIRTCQSAIVPSSRRTSLTTS